LGKKNQKYVDKTVKMWKSTLQTADFTMYLWITSCLSFPSICVLVYDEHSFFIDKQSDI